MLGGRTVRAALQGLLAGTYVQDDEEYDVRVRMDRRAIVNAADLGALPLVGRGGVSLTVGAVARVAEGAGPVEIEREQQRRVVRLNGDASGTERSQGEIVADAEQRLRAELQLPDGCTLSTGGAAEQQRESHQPMTVAALAIFLVYAIMALQYDGLLDPLVILLTVPLALTGVVLALKLRARRSARPCCSASSCSPAWS